MPRPEYTEGNVPTDGGGSFGGEHPGVQPEIKGVVPTSSVRGRASEVGGYSDRKSVIGMDIEDGSINADSGDEGDRAYTEKRKHLLGNETAEMRGQIITEASGLIGDSATDGLHSAAIAKKLQERGIEAPESTVRRAFNEAIEGGASLQASVVHDPDTHRRQVRFHHKVTESVDDSGPQNPVKKGLVSKGAAETRAQIISKALDSMGDTYDTGVSVTDIHQKLEETGVTVSYSAIKKALSDAGQGGAGITTVSVYDGERRTNDTRYIKENAPDSQDPKEA